MKKIISASRRTDLVAFFPEWLSSALKGERARVNGPSGYSYNVELKPQNVHTLVLWSKNFSNLIHNKNNLRNLVLKYDQLYFHFTITGLGGSFIEKGVPSPSKAISQLDPLLKIAGTPARISVRFDPIVYWKEAGKIKTNLYFLEKMVTYVDPSLEEKKEAARYLVEIAQRWQLNLFSCSQDFLAAIPGIKPSACIDGRLLARLHPHQEAVSFKKDKSQRPECHCTESVDIGSYTQFCPHSCLYCYANPRV